MLNEKCSDIHSQLSTFKQASNEESRQQISSDIFNVNLESDDLSNIGERFDSIIERHETGHSTCITLLSQAYHTILSVFFPKKIEELFNEFCERPQDPIPALRANGYLIILENLLQQVPNFPQREKMSSVIDDFHCLLRVLPEGKKLLSSSSQVSDTTYVPLQFSPSEGFPFSPTVDGSSPQRFFSPQLKAPRHPESCQSPFQYRIANVDPTLPSPTPQQIIPSRSSY